MSVTELSSPAPGAGVLRISLSLVVPLSHHSKEQEMATTFAWCQCRVDLTTIPAVPCPEYRKFCMGADLRVPQNPNAAVLCLDIAKSGNFEKVP
jgi:hypothetical protein